MFVASVGAPKIRYETEPSGQTGRQPELGRNKMKFMKSLSLAVGAAAMAATGALADGHATTKLRIQTHFSQETLSGQMAGEFLEDIKAMPGYYESLAGGTVER